MHPAIRKSSGGFRLSHFPKQPKEKTVKRKIAILAAISAITLAACGSKTDANEKNFGAALTQYLDKTGDLCLDIPRPSNGHKSVEIGDIDYIWEKTMGKSTGFRPGLVAQMGALEVVGLAKGEEIGVGKEGKKKRYTLTDAAKPFMQEKVGLCWGKAALDKVVKWEGPMKFGDYQEAGVSYTYKVNNLADWAKNSEIQAAFPQVKLILDGEGSKQEKHAVKLTSQGWEAKGLESASKASFP